MISSLKKLWNDTTGNVLVITAATMPLMIGAAGLATDTIQWTLWDRQLQRAADSAAMAGVYTGLKTYTQADVEAAVTKDLALNLHTVMALNTPATVTLAGTSGVMQKQVQVSLQVQKRLPFSSLFMSSAPTIRAVATAASVPSGAEYCVFGKSRSATKPSVTISGSANLNMGSCSLMSNSTHPTQSATNGTSGGGGSGSGVTAASLDAAGGVNYSSQWNVGTYSPYSAPIDDPFESKYTSIPTSTAGCTKTGVSINGNSNINRTTIASPDTATDVVCLSGNQTIGADVTLGPATYIISAGNLRMTSNSAALRCNGCTIIMTSFGNSGATTGTVNLNGGTIDMKPPRLSGGVQTGNAAWNGYTFYQDPRAVDDGSTAQNKINGNSSLSVQGIVYFGNQSLEFVGGGNATAACLQIVAARVTFSGSSAITAGSACAGMGMGSIGGTRRVRLVG